MPARIFVTYRREETRDVSRLIYDRLASAFGRSNIFFDVHEILLGTDFREQINQAMDQSHAVVAVIGPRWFEVLDQRAREGQPDWVRYELERALARELVVVPVLVDGARIRPARELPEALQRLFYRDSLEIHHDKHFENDVTLLISELQRTIESLRIQPSAGAEGSGAPFWDQLEGRRLGRRAVAWAGAILLALWVWRDLLPPSPIDVTALGHLLYDTCWITYDSSYTLLDARREPVFPPVQIVEAELRLIKAAGFSGVVTTTCRGTMAEVPRLARQQGLRVIQGIWDAGDLLEVRQAMGQAPYVDAYCVGHDGLIERYTLRELRRALHLIKKRTGLPATVSERARSYTPQLARLGDWVFPDAHLSLKDDDHQPVAAVNVPRDIDLFMKATEAMGEQARETGRPLLFKSVAYPYGGVQGGSRATQAEFYRGLLERLNDPQRGHLVKVSIVAQGAFDTPWKIGKPFLAWDPFTGLIDTGLHQTNRAASLAPAVVTPASLEILRWYPHLQAGATTNTLGPRGGP